MPSIRKAAELGWEYSAARPCRWSVAGIAMWVLLMEALRRTGGWSLLLSVLPFTFYPLFADAQWLGPAAWPAIDAGAGRRLSHAVQ